MDLHIGTKWSFLFQIVVFSQKDEQQQRKEGVPLEEERTVLGMHPRGWYSKVVPIHHCDLISPAMNPFYLLFNLINCILLGTIKNLKVYIDILFCVKELYKMDIEEKYLSLWLHLKATKEHVASVSQESMQIWIVCEVFFGLLQIE